MVLERMASVLSALAPFETEADMLHPDQLWAARSAYPPHNKLLAYTVSCTDGPALP
jgi:hypothetical protein